MGKQGTVVILTGNHICHNPRVFKEAETLTEAGFAVECLGGWFHHRLAERDMELMRPRKWRFTPVIVWTRASIGSKLQKLWQRARRWSELKVFHLLGRENGSQLGYCTHELFTAARARQADLFIAHSEPALWVAERLRRLGFRVGIDMEDWFSEDLLPEARIHRPVNLLRTMEKEILHGAAHSSCTSRAMSEALAMAYGCRPPAVLYNAFEWSERHSLDGQLKDRVNPDIPSIHWYSQTLGHGRGLEDLFAALPYVKHIAEVHLRGRPTPGFNDWVVRHASHEWLSRIFIHDLVSNNELLSRIAEHDIGFAGEMKYCRNKELTVSNKILQYLLGGLAVVASDTLGQREIMEQAKGAVLLYQSGDPQALAERLNSLLVSTEKLLAAKAAALRAAEQTFCWERQAPSLLRAVEHALRT